MSIDIATLIADSTVQTLANWLLANVPGLPPILQTIHLLSIAAIMASSVFINLRLLRLAVPTQSPGEMFKRLELWTWYGLLSAFSTGIWFVLARPNRYFSNPVFQIKLGLLLLAVTATLLLYRMARRDIEYWSSSRLRERTGKAIAAVSLVLWIGVTMAGRWIAYSEYLFWPG